MLLDDEVEVGVLRGGPATHPNHAGRRIFGSGVNLTHLHDGQISLVEFMIDRELGSINKMYRGHPLGPFDEQDERMERGRRREKPWIAAVDSFAIGGACQWLLVMDRVIAETGSYFNLPARKEGIIPGCANLRLPRFVGERLARRAIFFNHEFRADRPDGALLADEVVPSEDMDAAIDRAAVELTAAGRTSLNANRAMLRLAQEPLEEFQAVHERVRPQAGEVPLQPRAHRQPGAQLGRPAPSGLSAVRAGRRLSSAAGETRVGASRRSSAHPP